MSSTTYDARIDNLKAQIETAMSTGSTKDFEGSTASSGMMLPQVCFPLLDAYRLAALVNPSKAFKSKEPVSDLNRPEAIGDKDFWSEAWRVIQTVGPVLINALNQNGKAPTKSLKAVVAELPPERRDDPEFRAYAADLLLYVTQHTAGALSGAKNYADPATTPEPPQPPPGKDFWSDAWDFVCDAAPVVLPIVLSLL